MSTEPAAHDGTVRTTGLHEPAPDHLMRMELAVELAAPPEVVWEAIATGPGQSMWFLETDVEERVGGRVTFHMGPDMASEGEITAWEPATRLEYAEPGWVELAGRENSGQQALVSEFLIEATSGGTSVLRVVSSAYGTGAEWEREWFADMVHNWAPQFSALQRYVARFAGQPGVRLDATVRSTGDARTVWAQLLELLGSPAEGDRLALGDTTTTLERLTDEPRAMQLLLSFDGPEHGFGVVMAYEMGDEVGIALAGSLFGDDAARQVAELQDRWCSKLAPLVAG
jgi:uncharacterized protein YndB with AHSA1/START domain